MNKSQVFTSQVLANLIFAIVIISEIYHISFLSSGQSGTLGLLAAKHGTNLFTGFPSVGSVVLSHEVSIVAKRQSTYHCITDLLLFLLFSNLSLGLLLFVMSGLLGMSVYLRIHNSLVDDSQDNSKHY